MIHSLLLTQDEESQQVRLLVSSMTQKVTRKQIVYNHKSLLIYILRYGLVVRISGSHPGGPGSIPGNGIVFVEIKQIIDF